MRDDFYDPYESDVMYRMHELEASADYWKDSVSKLKMDIESLKKENENLKAVLAEASDMIRTTSEAADYWRSQCCKLLNSY